MKCPACDGSLSPLNVDSITVDVCKERCGGVWFDAGEFEKFDEQHEFAPTNLLRGVSNQNVVVDRNRARVCPRCSDGKVLTKQFYDAAHELQLDQCEACSGIWVDLGELETIREENKDAVQRQSVIDDFYARSTNPASSHKAKRAMRGVLALLFR